MERKIKYENWCGNCGHTLVRDIPDHECPECGEWMKHSSRITCDCGETISIDNFTNECNCGALYNSFGQRLSDPSDWEYEDRYACFGPQNELE